MKMRPIAASADWDAMCSADFAPGLGGTLCSPRHSVARLEAILDLVNGRWLPCKDTRRGVDIPACEETRVVRPYRGAIVLRQPMRVVSMGS